MLFGEAEKIRRMRREVGHAREVGLREVENTGVLQAFKQIGQIASPKYKTGRELWAAARRTNQRKRSDFFAPTGYWLMRLAVRHKCHFFGNRR